MSELAGKTLVITGASGGIGRALCLELAGEGVNLVLNARTREPLEEVAGLCLEARVRVGWSAGSAADDEVAVQLVEKALEIGNFHGFIHAAGVLFPGPLTTELSGNQFREIFEASVEAGFRMAKAAFPLLGANGVAVFFGSGAAEIEVPGIGAYCAAKAAEEHLARQLAAESPRITTFIFRPGVVDTRMVRGAANAGRGGGAESLRKRFGGFVESGSVLAPAVPAKALVSILKTGPRRFHGKIATWRDGGAG